MAEIKRKAKAFWNGDLRSGEGRVSTHSGALEEIRYSFSTRFENEPGTNPEELIAAAHAACFSMAFANTLSSKGYTPIRVETKAVLSMERLEGGFTITKMRLETEGVVPGLDQATFVEIAEEAAAGCPVSRLLRPGLEIELEARLLVQ